MSVATVDSLAREWQYHDSIWNQFLFASDIKLIVYMFFVTCVKEAYTKLADLCHKRGWHLFYIRPKLHMVSEEGFLGYDACIYFIQKLGIHMYLGSEAEASDGTWPKSLWGQPTQWYPEIDPSCFQYVLAGKLEYMFFLWCARCWTKTTHVGRMKISLGKHPK